MGLALVRMPYLRFPTSASKRFVAIKMRPENDGSNGDPLAAEHADPRPPPYFAEWSRSDSDLNATIPFYPHLHVLLCGVGTESTSLPRRHSPALLPEGPALLRNSIRSNG